MTGEGSRNLRTLLLIVVAASLALGISWLVLADRKSVYEYRGPAPPDTGSLAMERPPRLALVLGGGGTRGIAHIGVLKGNR